MASPEGDINLSVPKFSSFKSKLPEVSKDQDEHRRKRHRHHSRRERGDDTDANRDSKRVRHAKDSHHGDRDHHRERSSREKEKHRRSKSPRDRRERGDSGDRAELTKGAAPQPSQPQQIKSDVFFFDTKGDPLIYRYGRLDRYQIPRYYRYGAGKVLGTSGRLFIHRELAGDTFSLRMPGEGSARYRERDGLRSKVSRLKRQPIVLRPSKHANPDDEADDGYIAVVKPRNRKHVPTDTDSEDSEDDQKLSYRSIEGKAKVKAITDSESSDESNSEDEAPPLEQTNPLKWRSIQLNRQVKDHPEDIAAWLELVDHQDALLKAGESLDHETLENEAKSFTEIKVSMLESALTHAKGPSDRSTVLNRLMREGIKVWTGKTAMKRWAELQGETNEDFELWKTHLDFAMSNISSFQYGEIKQTLLDRLKELSSSLAAKPSHDTLTQAVYVFLRLTVFVYDAGFKELAVAAWQSTLEATFFRPKSLPDAQAAFSSFSEFWESEVPRIGETPAAGWESFVNSGNDGDAPEPLQAEPGAAETSRDVYKSWAISERHMANQARKPARTMDEGTEDDPFRVVMYSDIQPFLLYIPEHALVDAKDQLMNAFFIFCGLPPLSTATKWFEAAVQDQFLSLNFINEEGRKVNDLPRESLDPLEVRKPSPRSGSVLYASCSTDLLFPDHDWYHYLGSKANPKRLEQDWILNVAKQLSKRDPTPELAMYSLALCSFGGQESVKSLAKGFLKRYPTSPRLYNAYALAEYAEGKVDVAKKVLSSATQLFLDLSQSEAAELWRTWSWIELNAGNQNQAARRLCSAADMVLAKNTDDEYDVSPTHVLKARRYFTSNVGYLASTGDVDGAENQGECLALLSYLTSEGCTEPRSPSQGNIVAAMQSIEMVSIELQASPGVGKIQAAHERLLQFAARLLYFNAMNGPSRREYTQHWLTNFIEQFPRNTIFLSLLEWSDSSLRVVDETRSLLYDKVLVGRQDCIGSRIFAIEHEMARGNVNTAKAAFEHAVMSDECKNNPQIWIGYIRHCYVNRELREKAKDVFYRGLRHCPWSKSVMMEAFGTLVHAMESNELKSVFDTMATKGLRIHVDLEGFLERRKDEERERGEENMGRKDRKDREKRRESKRAVA
ncbi:unnamed protein product [Clonostachys chloroleuca]|uniref:DUF1740-domain-containing protein n=1 Tax=Clonostachys chloroleuca TaxID=1926264 RepID=A0AA35M7S1_9HYPO|nr:unnamed protein product [Clonostachys chloroleuca]